ncbi:helix-turn-helix domain-containing protein [Mycobacterium marinum]|uniref:helix-turn-helix domain-containing protein n=1 Tax=Mycobacterium marinum TaxID=1781 RepID=UPI003B434B77
MRRVRLRHDRYYFSTRIGSVQQRGRPTRQTRSREDLAHAVVLTLAEARRKAGITRRRLAELSGVSVHTIAKIEQAAVTDPGFMVVAALAGELGLSLDALHQRATNSLNLVGVSRSD